MNKKTKNWIKSILAVMALWFAPIVVFMGFHYYTLVTFVTIFLAVFGYCFVSMVKGFKELYFDDE